MTTKDFYVELFDAQLGDSDYGKSKHLKTYSAAVRYAKKLAVNLPEHLYVFVYVPKNDGHDDYRLREDWSTGQHDKWLDAEIW